MGIHNNSFHINSIVKMSFGFTQPGQPTPTFGSGVPSNNGLNSGFPGNGFMSAPSGHSSFGSGGAARPATAQSFGTVSQPTGGFGAASSSGGGFSFGNTQTQPVGFGATAQPSSGGASGGFGGFGAASGGASGGFGGFGATKTVKKSSWGQPKVASQPAYGVKVGGGKVTAAFRKGGKGLGKGGAKRHRRILRDNVQGITKPCIRRLARRGGVKRLSGFIYEEVRGCLKMFLEAVLRDAITYTEHGRRKTVSTVDVFYALKRRGKHLYGFGSGVHN